MAAELHNNNRMALQTVHVFSNDAVVREASTPGDRRSRLRVVVHWPLIFRRHSGTISEAVTHNLSNAGLFFHADEPSVVGESLSATLMVPAHNPEDSTQVIPVNCRLRILRVEALAGNRFGIACRIEEYHVQPLPHLPYRAATREAT